MGESYSSEHQPVTNDHSIISPNIAGSSTTVGFVADVYLCKFFNAAAYRWKCLSMRAAYVFWSIFTSLIPTLFYFSVWELAIAGHELAFLAVLSPFLLSCIPENKAVDAALQLLSFTALGAYALPRPLHRLLTVTPAVMAAVMAQTRAWSRDSSTYQATGKRRVNHRETKVSWIAVTSLGFLLGSLLKHANHSNNPSAHPLSHS